MSHFVFGFSRMVTISPPPYRIYLLRHAEAGWAQPGERDFDRSLNDNGFAEAEIVADIASDRGYRPDLVISSTAARCRQTADAIRRTVDPEVEFLFVDELYNASLPVYIEILQSQRSANAIMLIGHNPVMEQTLEALIGHDALCKALPNGYPTAGLAILDAPSTQGAVWTLKELITD